MPGPRIKYGDRLRPGIHAFACRHRGVDARDKREHDGGEEQVNFKAGRYKRSDKPVHVVMLARDASIHASLLCQKSWMAVTSMAMAGMPQPIVSMDWGVISNMTRFSPAWRNG